ncbi:MAG: ATP-dependent DNA helicase RecG [Syntrophales bacterium]|jgi:ATP-dependent DNA helicase RecG|nr:ATP-dependent DNA helicase RecG [Syntrophales bacterium]
MKNIQTIDAILDKMENPLRFASRDGYLHLHLLRDVESLMAKLLAQLSLALRQFDGLAGSHEIGRMFMSWKAVFRHFDSLSLEEKKERVEAALDLHRDISQHLRHHFVAQPETLTLLHELLRRDMEHNLKRLALPVQYVRGVGPRISQLLAKKNLSHVEDLLYFFPHRYEDRRFVKSIAETEVGRRETIVGTAARVDMHRYGRKPVFEVGFHDGSGTLSAKWFRGRPAYLKNVFKTGRRYILSGEITRYFDGKTMIHPDFELFEDEGDDLLHFKRIVPVYSETEGLRQKSLRRVMMDVVEHYASNLMSPIPEDICRRRRLMDMDRAIRDVHFPPQDADFRLLNDMRSEAHRRLIYDEFFFFQLGMAVKKKGTVLQSGIAFKTGGSLVRRFLGLLPYELTGAQKRVIAEIEADMGRNCPMNRLLQGDVGSGKTVVSLVAMLTACDNGCQAVIMVPTEILAEQHHRGIGSWMEDLGVKTALLTGSIGAAKRRTMLEAIRDGTIQIVIGTHALFSRDTAFANLGLVVIDEQHRFGVIQRASIREKGLNPDVLVMTATPIPRTLAMTVYGDLDVSVIDELPPGKKPIRTKLVYEQQREKVYEAARKELARGNQVFVVYPLVEESETLDLKDATRMAEHLGNEVFPDESVGLIHGKLKAARREEIMTAFQSGQIRILVATTVIEVGIDVPRASLMIIEHAERFGLSQLHQLRGRVGRSDIPSTCILLVQKTGSEDARRRLKAMIESQDGFHIAEADLSIRGPGEFMGTRQSGMPDFRVASIVRDGKILGEAKKDAFDLIETDPDLGKDEHFFLREVLKRRWQGRLDIAKTA